MRFLRQFIFCALVCILFSSLTIYKAVSQSATVPISINVNGTLTISDANNDASSGRNPTINVNLSVTPDLGAAAVTGNANFRIRTNKATWKLNAQRTQEVDNGPTNITASDIGVLISTQAGSRANSMAGTLVAPFNSQTDLSKISIVAPVDVVNGTAKTSTSRDTTNQNNYFQINTQYSIQPDFFYQPGTWSTTITYNLVSP
jgi:hypothetical protein